MAVVRRVSGTFLLEVRPLKVNNVEHRQHVHGDVQWRLGIVDEVRTTL